MNKGKGDFFLTGYECFRLRFRGGVSNISRVTKGIKGGGGEVGIKKVSISTATVFRLSSTSCFKIHTNILIIN